MTPEQKLSFQDRGYLRLRRALGKQQIGSVKAHVLHELRRLNIWSSGKVLSPSIKSMPAFQQVTRVSGSIRQDGLDDRLIGKETRSAISSLAPGSLSPVQGQFLISLPNQGQWSLNGLNWHTDIAASANDRVPGIQAFVLIDDVEPRGGATLAIAGSHLLAGQKEPSSRLREILRKEGDVEGTLGKQGLSIVEMSGEAGDVYLMDMRLLHTPAINSTRNIRLMATVRYLPLDL